jgi:hypothetical protein
LRLIGFAVRVVSLAPGLVFGSCLANCSLPAQLPDSPGACLVSSAFQIHRQTRSVMTLRPVLKVLNQVGMLEGWTMS